jgi:hypothetical protein
MTARDIELSLATWMFPYWKWLIVSRTYQIVGHECDILAVTQAGYAHEVEIKVSLSDVKADLKKEHRHGDGDNRIKCFWFALPADLIEKAEPFIPQRAGIILISHYGDCGERAKIYRKPTVNRQALPWSFNDRFILARAGLFRYWRDMAKSRRAAQ